MIERLDARRTQGGARFLIIIGRRARANRRCCRAERAAAVTRRRRKWVVLPAIRPEKAPMETLAKAIAQHARQAGRLARLARRLGAGRNAAGTIERRGAAQGSALGEARRHRCCCRSTVRGRCSPSRPRRARRFPHCSQRRSSRARPPVHGGRDRALRRAGGPDPGERAGAATTRPFRAAMPLDRCRG